MYGLCRMVKKKKKRKFLSEFFVNFYLILINFHVRILFLQIYKENNSRI